MKDQHSELGFVWPPEGPEPGASRRVHLTWGVETRQGRQSAVNTDYYLIGQFERSMRTLGTNMPRGSVPSEHGEVVYGIVLADGVGHSRMAEVASRTAVSTLIDLVLGTPDWVLRLDDEFRRRATERFAERLGWVEIFLTDRREEMPAMFRGGATLTSAVINGHDLLVAHVGRSRVYHYRAGQLSRVTIDHDETQVLGSAAGKIDVDVSHVRLEDGDRVLLCSDGLVDVSPHAEITAILDRVSGPDAAARALVNRAVTLAAPDDVTVIVVGYAIS